MIINMKRDLAPPKIFYDYAQLPSYRGVANCTLGIARQKVALFQQNEELCSLRQTNLLLRLLSAIPVIGLFFDVPFSLFVKGENCGKLSLVYFQSVYHLRYGDVLYELQLVKSNTFILTKDGKQIGGYVKKAWTFAEQNEYVVSILTEDMWDMQIVLLIAMFIDVVFFRNKGSYILGYKYEKTFSLDELFKKR